MSVQGYQGEVNPQLGREIPGRRGGPDDAVDTGTTRADS